MKTYRKSLADVYALQNVLDYLADRADSFIDDVANIRERLGDADNEEDRRYFIGQVAEYEAKAAAFERLIEKLSK